MDKAVLEFYRTPAELTALEGPPLPGDVAALVRAVQGCVLHEAWADRYGVGLSDERRSETHIRRAEEMVRRILELDAQPLSAPRPPQGRLVGTCRHFSVLLVALLRQQGVPARARCGFATYFTPGRFEDHWLGEV